MSYPRPDNPEVLATVSQWLSAAGDLFVHYDWVGSGSGGCCYFIRSLTDCLDLLGKAHPRSYFEILRNRQYVLRGVADVALLDADLAHIKDGEWYNIVHLDPYPAKITYCGSGKTHAELKDDMKECFGAEVGVGPDPLDPVFDERWQEEHPTEVLIAAMPKRLASTTCLDFKCLRAGLPTT
ncbi:MAG TPA: hypothetical protein VL486_06000 [Verrucomicrobiae bacterium]|nr:hypothetical protein [Verrucomicrobiae bacterium]